MNFKRHTINDVYQSGFYQMLTFLFEGEFKTGLSVEALSEKDIKKKLHYMKSCIWSARHETDIKMYLKIKRCL